MMTCSRDVQGAHARSIWPAWRQEAARGGKRDVERVGIPERNHARVLGHRRKRDPSIRRVRRSDSRIHVEFILSFHYQILCR